MLGFKLPNWPHFIIVYCSYFCQMQFVTPVCPPTPRFLRIEFGLIIRHTLDSRNTSLYYYYDCLTRTWFLFRIDLMVIFSLFLSIKTHTPASDFSVNLFEMWPHEINKAKKTHTHVIFRQHARLFRSHIPPTHTWWNSAGRARDMRAICGSNYVDIVMVDGGRPNMAPKKSMERYRQTCLGPLLLSGSDMVLWRNSENVCSSVCVFGLNGGYLVHDMLVCWDDWAHSHCECVCVCVCERCYAVVLNQTCEFIDLFKSFANSWLQPVVLNILVILLHFFTNLQTRSRLTWYRHEQWRRPLINYCGQLDRIVNFRPNHVSIPVL